MNDLTPLVTEMRWHVTAEGLCQVLTVHQPWSGLTLREFGEYLRNERSQSHIRRQRRDEWGWPDERHR